MNKTQTIKTIKKYLSELNLDEILKDKEKEFFMIKHFNKSNKFKNAIKNNEFSHFIKRQNPEWKNSNCWFVVDKKNIETSVSPSFDVIANKRKEVNSALRISVSSITMNFKNNINWNVQKCKISGKSLTPDTTDIDHYDLPFKFLVSKWMALNNYTFDFLYNFIYREKSRNIFKDKNIENSFIEFHNNNTHLRAILKKLNKSNLNKHFNPRPYQTEISSQASEKLKILNIVYLAMQVRTGKTITALMTAQKYRAKNVLFLTKKRAIPSIESDYKMLNPDFKLTVINNESLHKVEDNNFDLLISDEHHRNGAFPKPNKITKAIKERFLKLPMIFLSGSPHPESYSQIYHQFWCSHFNPFKETNFYKWSKNYVYVKDRHLGYAVVKDYSEGKKELILPIITPYLITYTQKEAGFETEVKENVLTVKMQDSTYKVAERLKKDLFIVAKDNREIMADTAVKLMQKLHQIYSGTVIFEDGSNKIFDYSKANFIKEHFKGKRLGIFYKFKAEWELLKETFGDDLTNDLTTFDNGCKHIALQIVSGSEGISLRNADYLVYYNIDFSAKNYWQSRDRLTTMQRKSNDIFWIFSEGGIEENIYKKVILKKSYTSSIFKKEYEFSNQINQEKRSGRLSRT